MRGSEGSNLSPSSPPAASQRTIGPSGGRSHTRSVELQRDTKISRFLLARNRKFESISLQERVRCELGPQTTAASSGNAVGKRSPRRYPAHLQAVGLWAKPAGPWDVRQREAGDDREQSRSALVPAGLKRSRVTENSNPFVTVSLTSIGTEVRSNATTPDGTRVPRLPFRASRGSRTDRPAG